MTKTHYLTLVNELTAKRVELRRHERDLLRSRPSGPITAKIRDLRLQHTATRIHNLEADFARLLEPGRKLYYRNEVFDQFA